MGNKNSTAGTKVNKQIQTDDTGEISLIGLSPTQDNVGSESRPRPSASAMVNSVPRRRQRNRDQQRRLDATEIRRGPGRIGQSYEDNLEQRRITENFAASQINHQANMDFRESRRKTAAHLRADEAEDKLTAEKRRKAMAESGHFEDRLAAFREELDIRFSENHEPAEDNHAVEEDNAPVEQVSRVKKPQWQKSKGGKKIWTEDTLRRENHEWYLASSHARQRSSTRESESLEASPEEIQSQQSPLLAEPLRVNLPPIPDTRHHYKNLKLSSANSALPPSLHTGAELKVFRVPTEQIPPTSGISVMGTHPHSSAWTAVPWASAIVAFGMGAVIGTAGFGVYKLIRDKFSKENKRTLPTEKIRRVHARDWKLYTSVHSTH
jgi:hypothetical protein